MCSNTRLKKTDFCLKTRENCAIFHFNGPWKEKKKRKKTKNKTFAFKIDPVIVLTASSFKHPTISVNQYVDNESNQAVMGMTFWTKKEVSVLVRGSALAIDLCTLAPH